MSHYIPFDNYPSRKTAVQNVPTHLIINVEISSFKQIFGIRYKSIVGIWVKCMSNSLLYLFNSVPVPIKTVLRLGLVYYL